MCSYTIENKFVTTHPLKHDNTSLQTSLLPIFLTQEAENQFVTYSPLIGTHQPFSFYYIFHCWSLHLKMREKQYIERGRARLRKGERRDPRKLRSNLTGSPTQVRNLVLLLFILLILLFLGNNSVSPMLLENIICYTKRERRKS